MKPHILFASAALATLLLASQATAQSAQDPQPPTQVTTPSGPIMPAQKRELREKLDEQRTIEQQQRVEGTGAPATSAMPMSPDAMDVAAATAEPAVVTNGPVLDTAENRAKYPPLSRAGKQTSARGN